MKPCFTPSGEAPDGKGPSPSGYRLLAIEGGGAILHHRLAGAVQFPHLIEGWAEDGPYCGFEQGPEAGQHDRIAAVGLGQPDEPWPSASPS